MKIIGDYHTHTVYSHGKNTIRDNVLAAREKGLEEIAICDHGPGHVFYGVRKKNIYRMREEIDSLKEEFDDISILLGLEANVMSYEGDIDVDEDILEILDILLVGYHYGIVPRGLRSIYKFYLINGLSKKLSSLESSIIEDNTNALIRAIERYPIDLITHPGSKARIDPIRLGKECAKRGVCLEINSSHSQLDVENLRKAMETGVDFMINSDAHSKERVGNFDKGIYRALEVGLEVERIKNAQK